MIPRIEPMLAVAGKPFDSQDHLYEVKWDGIASWPKRGKGGRLNAKRHASRALREPLDHATMNHDLGGG